VVLSTDMEVPEVLQKDRHIFISDPTVDQLAKTMGLALSTQVSGKADLSDFTWESYCRKIFSEVVPLFT
jgi:hypothetical protein